MSTFSDPSYKRHPAVQAAIDRMLPLSHSDWVAEAPNLPSEALVFLIRQIGNGDPMIYGYLFQQLGRRIAPLARRATRGLDRETARELVLRIIERPIKMAPDHRSSPEEIVIALQDESRRKEWFKKACDSVNNPLHREVVLLHHVEEMSVQEIAQKLPARPAQVKYWLTAGLKVMRKALGVEPEGEKQ